MSVDWLNVLVGDTVHAYRSDAANAVPCRANANAAAAWGMHARTWDLPGEGIIERKSSTGLRRRHDHCGAFAGPERAEIMASRRSKKLAVSSTRNS